MEDRLDRHMFTTLCMNVLAGSCFGLGWVIDVSSCMCKALCKAFSTYAAELMTLGRLHSIPLLFFFFTVVLY